MVTSSVIQLVFISTYKEIGEEQEFHCIASKNKDANYPSCSIEALVPIDNKMLLNHVRSGSLSNHLNVDPRNRGCTWVPRQKKKVLCVCVSGAVTQSRRVLRSLFLFDEQILSAPKCTNMKKVHA